jgi:hypothetical protein
VLELAQSDAGLKFINANNPISYLPILDYYADKEPTSASCFFFTEIFARCNLGFMGISIKHDSLRTGMKFC